MRASRRAAGPRAPPRPSPLPPPAPPPPPMTTTRTSPPSPPGKATHTDTKHERKDQSLRFSDACFRPLLPPLPRPLSVLTPLPSMSNPVSLGSASVGGYYSSTEGRHPPGSSGATDRWGHPQPPRRASSTGTPQNSSLSPYKQTPKVCTLTTTKKRPRLALSKFAEARWLNASASPVARLF